MNAMFEFDTRQIMREEYEPDPAARTPTLA